LVVKSTENWHEINSAGECARISTARRAVFWLQPDPGLRNLGCVHKLRSGEPSPASSGRSSAVVLAARASSCAATSRFSQLRTARQAAGWLRPSTRTWSWWTSRCPTTIVGKPYGVSSFPRWLHLSPTARSRICRDRISLGGGWRRGTPAPENGWAG